MGAGDEGSEHEDFDDEEYDDEEYVDNGGLTRLLVGAVAGALVVGALWLGQVVLTSDDSNGQASLSSQSRPAAGTGAEGRADGGGGPEATRDSGGVEAACDEIFTRQTRPLRTASRALGQWEIHIAAMNQLVAGTISLPAARRYWEQTRQGAKERLATFESAMQEWARRDVRCPRPDQLPRRLRQDACVESVWKRAVTLRAASTSLHLWREHVHHMDMLRDGTMSAAEATRLWLKSWREGDRELQRYVRASRAAAPRGC